jgi:hypothetical protein
MYLGDTGGAVALSAVNASSFAATPYPWGDRDYAELPVALLPHMQVLKLPPQRQLRGRLVQTRCARFAGLTS